MLHPKDEVDTEFLIMFVGGIALYFGGIALSVVRAFQVLAFERLTAVAAIALVAFFGRSFTGVTLLMLVDLILLATIVFEHRRIESPAPAVSELAEQLLE